MRETKKGVRDITTPVPLKWKLGYLSVRTIAYRILAAYFKEDVDDVFLPSTLAAAAVNIATTEMNMRDKQRYGYGWTAHFHDRGMARHIVDCRYPKTTDLRDAVELIRSSIGLEIGGYVRRLQPGR